MVIEKQTGRYELLVRFDPATGAFVGAHAVDIENIIEDGTVISARTLPARPVTEAEFGDLMGSECAGMAERIAELEALLAAATAPL